MVGHVVGSMKGPNYEKYKSYYFMLWSHARGLSMIFIINNCPSLVHYLTIDLSPILFINSSPRFFLFCSLFLCKAPIWYFSIKSLHFSLFGFYFTYPTTLLNTLRTQYYFVSLVCDSILYVWITRNIYFFDVVWREKTILQANNCSYIG